APLPQGEGENRSRPPAKSTTQNFHETLPTMLRSAPK
ncbi:hypothetical protein AZZ94_000522, partial [Enterobacter hormaechei]